MALTIEQRLNSIIDEKDEEIESLKEQIHDLKYQSDLTRTAWQRHEAFDNDDFYKPLPFPRLEMRLIKVSKDDWYEIEWVYGLVYKHLIDSDNNTLRFIPFSKTTSSGGNREFNNWCKHGELELPFRDRVHIKTEAIVLNLPAYIVCKELGIVNKIELSVDHLKAEMAKMKTEGQTQ